MNKNKRERVFQLTNYKCAYCGIKLTEENATIDHIIPKNKGGTNCFENLIPSCNNCNGAKGNKTRDEYREHLINTIRDLKQKLYSTNQFYYEKPIHNE